MRGIELHVHLAGCLYRHVCDQFGQRQRFLDTVCQVAKSTFLRHTALQRRQLVQALQPQVVEKLARGGVQRRSAGGLAVTDDFHPTTVFELFDQQRVDRHSPDVFHVAARNRLAVGDDGQRLERGAGVARRLFGVQPIQVLAHLGPTLKTPAAGHAHQFDTAAGPVVGQILEQRLEGVGTQRVVEQHAHVAQRQRLLRTNQCGFENTLCVRHIHSQAFLDMLPMGQPINEISGWQPS